MENKKVPNQKPASFTVEKENKRDAMICEF